MSIFKEKIGERGPWCVITHGLGEHSGRYKHIVKRLREENFGVVLFDLKGHGKSEGRRGDIEKFDDYLDNIDEAVSLIPEDEFHLFGHSMGGLIALRYAMKKGDKLKSLVLSAPLLQIKKKIPTVKLLAGKILYRIFPRFPMNNEVDPHLLSHNEEVVNAYINDPLVHNKVTVRWFFETLKAMEESLSHPDALKTPTLFLHGSEDELTDPSATKEFYERVTCEKKLIIYEGFYHEPFNEFNGQKVIEDIVNWLKAHN